MVYRIDQPTHRTEYQKETGAARFYYLRPIGFGSAMLGRVYKRNTHPGDSEMCICICNQRRNARDAKGICRPVSANRYNLISKPINSFETNL